jgi:hypothetical protein
MKAWTNVRILDGKVPLYRAADKSSLPICEITDQPEGEITSAVPGFIRVKLAGGRNGFLDGKVTVFTMQEMSLKDDRTLVYGAPAANSPVIATLTKDTRVKSCNRPVERDGVTWVPIKTGRGEQGYIPGDVRVVILPAKPRIQRERSDSFKDLAIGGGVCLVGIIVTAATYAAAADSGGHYVVAWGAVLFGGIQFCKGVFQMICAEG